MMEPSDFTAKPKFCAVSTPLLRISTEFVGIADRLTQPSTVNAGNWILLLLASWIAFVPEVPPIALIVATPAPFVVGDELVLAL